MVEAEHLQEKPFIGDDCVTYYMWQKKHLDFKAREQKICPLSTDSLE